MEAKPLRVVAGANAELSLRVKRFLAERHFPGLRRIDVTALDDTVILNGRVHSFHERQLAVACCQRVAGVRQVVDQLEVSDSPLSDDLSMAEPWRSSGPLVAVETRAAMETATKAAFVNGLPSVHVAGKLRRRLK